MQYLVSALLAAHIIIGSLAVLVGLIAPVVYYRRRLNRRKNNLNGGNIPAYSDAQ
jgi:hypothetical protein